MAADGGLSDITNLLSLVKDGKTTTSTSTNLSQAGVTQQINDILQSNSGLASVAGAQKSAGLYNGSTNTLLTNDLLARATAQVAAKNATTTTTTNKKAPLSGKLTSAVATAGAIKSLIGGATAPISAHIAALNSADAALDSTATATEFNATGAGVGSQIATSGAIEGSVAGGDLGLGSLSAGTFADGSAAGIGALTSADLTAGAGSGAVAGGTDVAGLTALDSAAAADSGAADLGLSAAATDVGAADVAGLATADSAAVASEGAAAGLGEVGAASAGGDLAAFGPYGLAAAGALFLGTKYGSQIDDSITQPAIRSVGDTLGDSLEAGKDLIHGDIGGSLSAVGDSIKTGTGWIVCTELLRQGKFNRRHYAAGLRIFQSYPQHLLCGYYVWASPLVLYIRRNPGSWITSVCKHVFGQRAEFLAARAGVSGARDTVYGQSISALMFGFCWILGHALNLVGKKEVNYGRT